jgi:hypothetical protein
MSDPSPSPHAERLFFPALGLVLALGLGLRLAQSERVWTYWTLDYLSYYGPLRDELASGSLPWTRLVGLHPPQHGLLAAGMLAAGGSVASLLGVSVALSLGATALAALTLRRLGAPGGGLVTAAALALSPYQVHYGVELNNYPLFLFGGAALVWATTRSLDGQRGGPILLGLSALTVLHGHGSGLPLVLGLLAVFTLTRRWRHALTLMLALLLFAPVGGEMLGMLGGDTTFHNSPAAWGELSLELQRAWVGRFGPAWGLAAAVAMVPLALVLGLREPARRPWMLGGALLLLLALVTVVAGMRSGAAHVAQTPYWIFSSWLAWLVVGLGWTAAGRGGRSVLGLLLGIWITSVGLGLAQAPPTQTASDGAARALRDHIGEFSSPGDAIVYLWEPLFLNDSPRDRDPLLAAFERSEIGDWQGADQPCRNYNFRWKQRSLCLRAASGMRGGEHEEALAEDLRAWLQSGTTVHLIQAGLDPGRPIPDATGLKSRLAPQNFRWEESRPGGIRVVRITPPSIP